MMIGLSPLTQMGVMASASRWFVDQLDRRDAGAAYHRALKSRDPFRYVVLRHGGQFFSSWRVEVVGSLVSAKRSFALRVVRMRWGGVALVRLPAIVSGAVYPIRVLDLEARENRKNHVST